MEEFFCPYRQYILLYLGAADFVLIALASIAIDFFVIRSMDQLEGKKRFLFLWLSIVLNVALLLYFKYANFFIDNLNSLLGDNGIKWTSIVLPIGISFFTFQKISYSVDVFKRVQKPLRSIVDYTLYILLFPQLIAGPIVRYKEIAAQLISRNDSN